MNIRLLALVIAVYGGIFTTSPAAAPRELKAEPVPNALGLALNEYTFGWTADGQESYRILVASDEGKLAAEVGDLWDSGRRYAGESAGVVCRGKAFPAGATVFWKVQTWGADGAASEFSKAASIAIPVVKLTGKPQTRPTHWLKGKQEFMEGRVGRALRSGRGRAPVYSPDYEELRSAEGTTIAAWIRPEKAGDGWQSIYRKEDGNYRRFLAIGKAGKDPKWGLWCGFHIGSYREFGAAIDPAKLTDGAWHHVAVTYDGKFVRHFLDGKKIGEEKIEGRIGGRGAGPAYLGSFRATRDIFEGGIDEVRVYDRGLTGEAVAKLAAGGKEAPRDGLVAHWPLDDNIENAATFLSPPPLGTRVALIGDSLVSRMEKYGYFETAVTGCWPHHDLTFRNLGWPGDDVFGTARAEFKDGRNTRGWESGPPDGAGYQDLMQQVTDSRAGTIIVGYGSSVAFPAAGMTLDNFKAGYAGLLKALASEGTTLILLTPPPQEAAVSPLPDLEARNQRLEAAADFILAQGKEHGHRVIDLFRKLPVPKGEPMTENGLHLNDLGYRRLAALLVRELGLQQRSASSVAVELEHGVAASHGGATVGAPVVTHRGMRFDVRLDQLPCEWLPRTGAIRIPKAAHNYRLRIDGVTVFEGPADSWRSGHPVSRGPELEASERLRTAIIAKNLQHRRRLRPLNKTYIFLHRSYEMGHLRYEMGDFDLLIAADEEGIAKLRVPQARRYALVRIDEWKPVHDDPEHEVPRVIPEPDTAAELAGMTVPEGYKLNLFASDPVLANPINLNWDTRGRAWVTMSSTYPHIKPGREPDDRIVILEDSNGDGVADKWTVFADGLLVPHSVMPVEGGAYVCSATEFLFLADTDGDDRADDRRVVFGGFGNADVHHMIHGLRWAPWGELYFNQSIYINSFIETRWGKRRLNGSGVWRFRPETERLEIFARGAVNPWGHAFDRWGQSFITDGAGGHGPHYTFPGAAFRTAFGAPRTMPGLVRGKPNATGGEFLSGRHFPEEWRGSFVENDFRANRTVRYELKDSGSGFAAKEVETLIRSNRKTFRPVDLKVGPDGALYIVDWYNAIIDHGEVDFHHPLRDKSHGRIWRLQAKDRPLVDPPVIHGGPVGDLLERLKAPEDYTRSQAKRELATRPKDEVLPKLAAWVKGLSRDDPGFEHHRLEALWTYGTMHTPDAELLREVLRSPEPRARANAVRILFHWRDGVSDTMNLLAKAVEDEHPRVRLEAVNVLRETGGAEAATIALRARRLPLDQWLEYAIFLTARELRDEWLPAFRTGKIAFNGPPVDLRYALEAAGDPRAIEALRALWPEGKIAPADRPNAIRTIVSLGSAADLQFAVKEAGTQPALLPSIAAGARDNPAKPEDAAAAKETLLATLKHADRPVREAAAELLGRWGLGGNEALAGRVRDAEDASERAAAATALARLKDFEALAGLGAAKEQEAVRIAAVAAWGEAQPAEASQAAADLLAAADDPEAVAPVFSAFINREFGTDLLAEALAKVKLKEAVAVTGIRLLRGSGREFPGLVGALGKAGSLKTVPFNLSPAEREMLIAEVAKKGDAGRGAEAYGRKSVACTLCHQIGVEGGKVGPDLTSVGAYSPPAAILDSILDPNRHIKQGYETMIVTRKDDTVVAGILQRRSDTATIIRDAANRVVAIPTDQVKSIEKSPVSLMPPGLAASLRKDELIDLLRFLTGLGKAEE